METLALNPLSTTGPLKNQQLCCSVALCYFLPNSRQNAFVDDLVSFLLRTKKLNFFQNKIFAMFSFTLSQKLYFFCFSNILRTDRDISKIPTDTNSAKQKKEKKFEV